MFRFAIKDGVIDLHSTYRYERSATTNLLVVTNATFALKSLKVVEKDTGQAVAEAANFVVSGASVDAIARQAEAGTVTITDGRFLLRRNKDTSVNAIELSKPAAAAPNPPGGILLLLRAMTNVVAKLLNSTNLSNGTIGELSLTNCALRLEDLGNSQPVRLDLHRIAVNARNISNRAGSNLTAGVSLRWDTNGTVRADIKATLSPASAEVTLAFDKLNLRPLAPYLEPRLHVLVLGSELGLAGTVRWRGTKDELPKIHFQGDAWLDEFSTAEGLATEGLLRWGALRLTGMEASLNPPVISVAKASLEDVFARLIIETNGTINLLSALRWGGTNTASVTQGTNVAVAARPRVSLASVVLSNANVHFIDRSLQPNVNITLEQLSGTISGLSSDAPGRADVQLQGTVDKTARAEMIDLKVPVTGSLDDPQFDMGKVVYRALETVLTRIATSPFSALGAIFGGKGEELSFLEFQPGSTNLMPAAAAKLDLLAKGLYARPELQLEIKGSADAQTDLEALRREKLNEQWQVQNWAAAASPVLATSNATAPESLPAQAPRKSFPFEKGATALNSAPVYWPNLPFKSTPAETNSAPSPLRAFADDKGATALMLIFAPAIALDPDWERELLQAVEIAPDALATLAVERARNVKAYLLQTGKVEAQRITEIAPVASSKGSRVYVRLQ